MCCTNNYTQCHQFSLTGALSNPDSGTQWNPDMWNANYNFTCPFDCVYDCGDSYYDSYSSSYNEPIGAVISSFLVPLLCFCCCVFLISKAVRNNQQQQQTVIVNQTVVMQGQNLPGQPVTPINIQTAAQPSIPEATQSVNTANV